MKQIYFTALLLFSLITLAQPSGYYDAATGSGFTLKTQLKTIIDDNDDNLTNEYIALDLGYDALYDTFQNSDVDLYYEDNGTLLDMYSEGVMHNADNTNTNLPDAYEYTYGIDQDDGTLGTQEGQRYNREHTIPQSAFNSGSPMRNDAHFVIPTDKYVNAQRGNLPYGFVNTSAQFDEYSNGTRRGESINTGVAAGFSGDVFEPIDEFKGDIARFYFYFATRYEAQITGFDYVMFDGSSDQAIDQPFLDVLYNWHIGDPVSQREIDRNNAIFAQQNNRNPFIDNPGYVSQIWQSVLSTENQDVPVQISMFPNPVRTNQITIQSQLETQVEIYNILGKKIVSAKVSPNQSKLDVSSLNAGVYLVRLTNKNGAITKKLIRQ